MIWWLEFPKASSLTATSPPEETKDKQGKADGVKEDIRENYFLNGYKEKKQSSTLIAEYNL